ALADGDWKTSVARTVSEIPAAPRREAGAVSGGLLARAGAGASWERRGAGASALEADREEFSGGGAGSAGAGSAWGCGAGGIFRLFPEGVRGRIGLRRRARRARGRHGFGSLRLRGRAQEIRAEIKARARG